MKRIDIYHDIIYIYYNKIIDIKSFFSIWKQKCNKFLFDSVCVFKKVILNIKNIKNDVLHHIECICLINYIKIF